MQNGSERRGGPRFEVFAQASVVSGGDSYLMSVRNVSAGGAFLEGSAREHPDLTPGVAIELVLSPAAPEMGDEEVVNIRCRGLITRVEMGTPRRSGGFGISLEASSPADQAELDALLRRLSEQQGAVAASSAG